MTKLPPVVDVYLYKQWVVGVVLRENESEFVVRAYIQANEEITTISRSLEGAMWRTIPEGAIANMLRMLDRDRARGHAANIVAAVSLTVIAQNLISAEKPGAGIVAVGCAIGTIGTLFLLKKLRQVERNFRNRLYHVINKLEDRQ